MRVASKESNNESEKQQKWKATKKLSNENSDEHIMQMR